MDSGKMFVFPLVLPLTIFSGSLFVTWLKKLLFFLGKISFGFKKANLVSMTRAATENNKNVRTKIVAATFENDFGSVEVSGEKVWKNFGYFDARKSDCSMEKVNYLENTLFFYLNQSYLIVKENKKNFLLRLFHCWSDNRIVKSTSGCFLLHPKRE